MTNNQSLVTHFIESKGNTWTQNIIAILLGVAFVASLAQVVIPLPHTPVPITAQTFGVALMSLLWGRKRGSAVMLSYLSLGAMGLPLFSFGRSFIWSPTIGYILGMLLASFVMGHMADRGFSKTFPKALLTTYVGSIITFSFGLLVLSFFVPKETLLWAGLITFLPGDLIKNILAAGIATKANKLL